MSADILTTNAAHRAFPRGLAISDLDLRDDRYPAIASRQVPSLVRPGPQLQDNIPSHSPFYPDAVHSAIRAQSLSSTQPPHDLNMPSLKSSPTHADPPRTSDERRPVYDSDSLPPPFNPGTPTSYTLDVAHPTNGPPSMNDINLQLFGPSQASQASSGEASRLPPTGDLPASSQQPRPPPLVPSWPASPQDSQLDPYRTSPRSGAATGQGQGIPFSGSMSPGMRMSTTAQYSPALAMPISVSPNPRAQAQQPTYITPTPAPKPINPVFTTQPLPAEEVCVECAMRDQDMADVDATSPGVWARESDVHYEELLRREIEEEATGVISQEPHRPRARGGRLTEPNLKLWLSLNPKEPASKGEALEKYVKMQQTLLEAEALAHARAAQESRQLEDRMRDAYSQLRRSAYDLGVSTSPDDGGVRIKGLRNSTLPLSSHTDRGREVTLLENGMIVEHVDVRKEEREERERRRREEKRARARKSSRGSVIDVASMYSTVSPVPHTDSGLHLGPSRSSTSRPMSVLTAPMDGTARGLQSNASVEALSMISAGASPNRRTRFFGMRNLSAGFRSSDSLAPSGFSGSMVDMHVALQHGGERTAQSPVDASDRHRPANSWRNSSALIPQRGPETKTEEKPKKKKGLAKIWRLMTGSQKHGTSSVSTDVSRTRSLDREHDDDYPLAPPPPLSYLVSRGTGEHGGPALRHVSTPSLPSSSSPNYAFSSAGVSPPTAPSSLLPSPTSSRPVVIPEMSESRKTLLVDGEMEHPSPVPEEEPGQTSTPQRSVHPTTSEPDLRHRLSQGPSGPVPPVPRIPASISQSQTAQPQSSAGWRDKVLPPLPGEVQARQPTPHAQAETRPRTLFSYDMREVHQDQLLSAPQAPFARPDMRRQSFNGISNSRPSLVVQTLPARGNRGFDAEKYGEFGASRGALTPAPAAQPASTKRKSKFGFAALLGRRAPAQEPEPVEFPSTGRSSGSEARHEAEMGMGTAPQYGSVRVPGHGHGHVFPRLSMSLTPRKNIESLVDQSPDFVAYRYPSGDQSLQLLR
ncbi:hypothetical protein BC834DRAFT_969293 [Gloeopeniophorella convolvens]|nr:hypothetical protein BC834DRAFT_969293 [Gloeopeniophorella convolvens]